MNPQFLSLLGKNGRSQNKWAIGLMFFCTTLMMLPSSGNAQWMSQSMTLTQGWNAVYLHVDASYDTLANMVGNDAGNPIVEIWRWVPTPSTTQFAQSPQAPGTESTQWASWVRTSSASSFLQRLVGNSAYLVKVGTNVTSYTWTLKGKPLGPSYQWTTTGLNFLGFPMVPGAPPAFETFLSQTPEFQQNAEIYRYVGGELGPSNPARIFAFRTTTVNRGQAYWMRSGNLFNRYFAPFEVAIASQTGVNFKDSLSTFSFRLRNLALTNVTVTMQLLASELPPAGQKTIAGPTTLLVRGSLNPTNLTYGYASLPVNGIATFALSAKGQQGSEVEVVLGLNRTAIVNNPGDLLAGILRLTDSLGFSQINLPVSAVVGSSAGLWVGSAEITTVGQYLKTFERDAQGNPVVLTNGQYEVSEINTNLTAVPRPYNLRLIVHNPTNGNAMLLQRVFCGLDSQTNAIVSTGESALNRVFLSQARRISATHLPFNQTNAAWAFNGRFRQTTNLTATVNLDYAAQESNPFLHTYHPDHDNLNTTFSSVAPQGSESYTVSRIINLKLTPPANDFSSLTAGSQRVFGNYAETISIKGLARAGGTNDTRKFEVRGIFNLNRVSDVPTLTTAQ